jgi:hypothetical protein
MHLSLYLYAPYLCIYVYVYVYVYIYMHCIYMSMSMSMYICRFRVYGLEEGGRGQRGVVDRGVGEQRGAGGARVQEGAL